jgi:hypothetical protein
MTLQWHLVQKSAWKSIDTASIFFKKIKEMIKVDIAIFLNTISIHVDRSKNQSSLPKIKAKKVE